MIDTSPDTPLLLYFPKLDPKAVRTKTPSDVFFFDPGVPNNPWPRVWKPDNLPLTEDMVRAFLRESERFALEHGKAGIGLTARALNKEDFYAQTSLAIRARLTKAVDPKESIRHQAVWAQQVLLLAWQLEQQTLEIQAMQQTVHAGLDELSRILGVDETDESPFSTREIDQSNDYTQEEPWRAILEAVLFFTPPTAVLVTGEREILAAFEESPDNLAGTVSAATSLLIKPLIATGAGRLIHGPGWRLAGRTQCPADKPWLELPRSVLFLASHGQTSSLNTL